MSGRAIINTRWCFMQALFCLLTVFAICTFDPIEWWYSIVGICIGASLFTGYAILFPCAVRINSLGITVYYMLGHNTFAPWDDIRSVVTDHRGTAVFPWQQSYEIGYFKTGSRFKAEASVPKTKRITAELKKYRL